MPNDTTAEQAVLGCLLVNPDALPLVRLVLSSPKMFHSRPYGMIFHCMCKVVDKGDPLDHVVIGAEMKRLGYLESAGGVMVFEQLIEQAVPSGTIEHYAKIVRKMHTLREVIRTAKEVASNASKIPDEPDVFYSDSKKLLAQACNPGDNTGAAVTAEQGANLVWEHLEEDQTGKKGAYIPTGYHELKLPRGIVSTIGGRTSNAKTAFALNIQLNAARMGYKCLHVSLEDNAVRFYIRVMSNLAQVTNTHISDCKLDAKERQSLLDAANVMRELPLSCCAKKGITTDFVRQYATTYQEMHGLDILTVDYIQLFKGRPKQSNYDKVSEAMQEMVVLSEELNVATICVSQVGRPFNKDGVPKIPTMHDLKESGEIENASKLIMLVHRPYVYNKEEDPTNLQLNVAKASEGTTGIRTMKGVMWNMWIGNGEAQGDEPPIIAPGTYHDQY